MKNKPCAPAVEEAVKISDMICEEDPEISVSKTQQLLSEAQLLMSAIEEQLDWCTSTGFSQQRQARMMQQESQTGIMKDKESTIIDGFMFESFASVEDLGKLSSQAAAGGRQGHK